MYVKCIGIMSIMQCIYIYGSASLCAPTLPQPMVSPPLWCGLGGVVEVLVVLILVVEVEVVVEVQVEVVVIVLVLLVLRSSNRSSSSTRSTSRSRTTSRSNDTSSTV